MTERALDRIQWRPLACQTRVLFNAPMGTYMASISSIRL